jgi:hypothetical protein
MAASSSELDGRISTFLTRWSDCPEPQKVGAERAAEESRGRYDSGGKRVERHEKFPVDKGHQKA